MQGSSDSYQPILPVSPLLQIPVVVPISHASNDEIQKEKKDTSNQVSKHLPKHPLHRIAEVRKTQGVSIANVSRRLNLDVEQVREQEKPEFDLLLSQLHQWREVLDAPICELLVEPDDSLDNPIRSRAALVRIMKTVRSILEKTHENAVRHLAQSLFDQLIDMMPELKEVTAWPTIGQSREFKDYGQAIYRRFDNNVEQNLLE